MKKVLWIIKRLKTEPRFFSGDQLKVNSGQTNILIDNNQCYKTRKFSQLTKKQKTKKNEAWLGLVWFGLVLWLINHCILFNAKFIFMLINSSISNNSV